MEFVALGVSGRVACGCVFVGKGYMAGGGDEN